MAALREGRLPFDIGLVHRFLGSLLISLRLPQRFHERPVTLILSGHEVTSVHRL